MNSRRETIASIYPGHAAMPLAQCLVLILLGMPSHPATTDTNLSAGHVQSPCDGERTLRENRKASSLSSGAPYPVWTLSCGGTSCA